MSACRQRKGTLAWVLLALALACTVWAHLERPATAQSQRGARRSPATARPATAATNPRVGFYGWVSRNPGGGNADLLTLARQRVKATGAGLLRVYVGPRFDYVHPLLSPARFPGLKNPTPSAILQLPRYRAVIEDPAIRTVVLTAYPGMDYGAGLDDIHLTRPWSAREERQEYSQIRELAEYLFEKYAEEDKTIVVANTEADDKMLEVMNYSGSPEMAIENVRQWQNTRYRAVDDARRQHPDARLKLLSAFEISLVNLKIARYQGRFVKRVTGEWNALKDVVPYTRFDLLSYSTYESTNAPYDTAKLDTPPADVRVRLLRDLRTLQKTVSQPVMIGELGIPYDQFDRLPSGGVEPRLAAALDALRELQPAYVVFWQVFDAPPEGSTATGFGWLDPRRKPSPAMLRFISTFR